MPDVHCVIDTSALLKRYFRENGSPIIDKLFDDKNCARHILNITVAEVMGAFFRWQLKGKNPPQQREKLTKDFKQDREDHKLISHTVNSRNISRIKTIYEISVGVPAPKYKDEEGTLKEKERVSPFDVVVLAVCEEIKDNYGSVCLFSSDEHLLKVAEKMGIITYNPEEISKLPFH